MKKLLSIIAAVLVVALLVVYVPYYFHTCDSCGEFFVGPGYDANLFVDLFTKDEQIICAECAEKHHIVGSGIFGKDLSEYSRPAIVDPYSALMLLFQ